MYHLAYLELRQFTLALHRDIKFQKGITMELTQKQNIRIISALLFLTVISQALYTALYVAAKGVPRSWIWSLEGLFFILLAAIAGSALVQAKRYTLGFSAIFASAIFNFVQVGIGLTQFGPFREAAQSVELIAPAAGSVVALSFFMYNAAKILLGIAAIVFGTTVLKSGSKLLGRITIVLGVAAIVANTIVMMFGRIEAIPSGAIGVLATLMLAVCLFKLKFED